MSRRRQRVQTSSLDLFLDTICNAFGGIMFISILISILIQMRGNSNETTVSQSTITEVTAIDQQAKVKQLQHQVRIHSETVTERERLLLNEDSAESTELFTKKDLLVESLEKIQQDQQKLLDTTAAKTMEIQKSQMELQNLSQRLTDARLAVSERSKELDEALDSVETTTTLPKVSSTFKGNLMFAMRYGKLYLITDVDGTGSNGIHSQHATSVNLGVGVQVRLKQAAGWGLDSPQDMAALDRVLQKHLSSDTFISVAVFSDAHADFSRFKAKLIQMQYDYDLLPLDNPDTLMIVQGGSATVQ
jgi:hypothetical protein